MKKHKGKTIRKVGKYTVINCKSCKFIHIHPIPSNEELHAFYNNDFYQKTKPNYIQGNEKDIQYLNYTFDEKLDISYKILDKSEFKHSREFKNFCLNYSKERFSNKPLSRERLDLILIRENYNKIFIFYRKNNPIGYVLTYTNKNIIHYWFSFYDTKFMKDFSLGKYIMEQVIFYAKNQKINFVYLGTCYGKKSLYKVRDFKGIEFYDGNGWNNDVKILKKLCKEDSIN